MISEPTPNKHESPAKQLRAFYIFWALNAFAFIIASIILYRLDGLGNTNDGRQLQGRIIGSVTWAPLLSLFIAYIVSKIRKQGISYGLAIIILLVGYTNSIKGILKEYNRQIEKSNISEKPQMSVEDKMEIVKLSSMFITSPEAITTKEYISWWGLFLKYKISAQDMNMTLSKAIKYHELFLDDALITCHTHQPTKSRERERLEKELIKNGIASEFQIIQKDDAMRKIAAGERVIFDDGMKDVVTSENLRISLKSITVANEKLRELFSKEWR